MSRSSSAVTGGSLLPLVLVTSLFFLWGFSYGLLDVLNKHFQQVLHVGKGRSALLQAVYFGAYFVMALPAGRFMQRAGYKRGVLAGLLLFAAGAVLFYPAATGAQFTLFLVALFVLACGLAFLETAANPYMTVLGPPEGAAFRLNLAQSFNGVGSFIGPLLGGYFFFGNETTDTGLDAVSRMYLAVAVVVLGLAVLFRFTSLPEPETVATPSSARLHVKWYFKRRFLFAVAAQFFYVAAQVGIAAFFINYATDRSVGMGDREAAYLLSVAMVLFTAGRFTGSMLMRRIPAGRLLTVYAFVAMLLCLWVALTPSPFTAFVLAAVFFFESVMFPTIFALGVKDMGPYTKLASSVIVMSIAGGAVVPYFMGLVAEGISTATAYLVPALCFTVVAAFGYFTRHDTSV
ncbi:MAG: hypothetical protein RL213_1504 [Bacteroidota bacterium]